MERPGRSDPAGLFAPRRTAVKPNSRIIVSGTKAASAARIRRFWNVATYRLYCLDGMRMVASGEWIEAEDDWHAIELAKTMVDGMPCELWLGRRLVTRIAHDRQHG